MARTRAFVLFVAVLLVLSGCKAFFDFNAFSSLDKAAVPDPSRYQGSQGLVNLQSDLKSQAIVNALKGDPGTVATILGNLNTGYGVLAGGYTTPDQRSAAILYAQLELASTSGDALVNNVVATLMTQPSGNLKSMLSSIIPPDVAGDITKFGNMVTNLNNANAVYILLGNSLPPAPPGMNMGDVAQKAAVAYLMQTIFTAVTGVVGAGNEIPQMFALTNNQANSISGVTIPDPFNPMSAVPWLKNIFDSAGAPYPA